MNYYWIPIGIAIISVGFAIKRVTDKSKDFSKEIEAELKKHGFKFVSSQYPGLFKVGPFKKVEITIGKPQINNGTVQYENRYYRIVEFRTKDNRTERTWAKIDTSWFKETQIEFKPRLSMIHKKSK